MADDSKRKRYIHTHIHTIYTVVILSNGSVGVGA